MPRETLEAVRAQRDEALAARDAALAERDRAWTELVQLRVHLKTISMVIREATDGRPAGLQAP